MDIKLYLAILNKGWLRREISARVLPQMIETPGVKITWENPAKTWDHPISSNRNGIRVRYLKTDCDFVLMIDDDVVPLSNPAELVFADKDVIGMPAKVRQEVRSLNWAAYVKNEKDEHGYAPVDFDRVDTDIDLLRVDAVGTGCILIKRKVLESIEAPFNCKYDKDGILTMGTDMAFCERAKAAGFEIYTTPQRICEHFKEIGMADFMSYDDSDGRDELPDGWDLPMTAFSIVQGDWRFIKDIIRKEKIKTVLEFGAGLSSMLIAQEVEKIVSYETDDEHANLIISKSNGKMDVRLWDGKSKQAEMEHLKADLIFVDGPSGVGVGGIGREHSIRIASECADRVVVHDAMRKEEWHWQKEFFKPDFKLVSKSGHHETRCNYWVRRSLL